MRDVQNNFLKLLAIAMHLEEVKDDLDLSQLHFAHTPDNRKLIIGLNGKYYFVWPYVLYELPKLFNEWYLSEAGFITYLPMPGLTCA